MRWYSNLVPNLSNENYLLRYEIIQPNNIVVCRQTEKGRNYAVFSDFIDFYKFLFSVDEDERCFYEVIRNRSQKPYFDIDLKTQDISVEKTLKYVKKAILIFSDYIKTLTDKPYCIQLFSSHNAEKISFHIVIDGIYLGSSLQGKLFFETCMKSLPDHISCIFDDKIYNANRQFRTLFSKKFGSNRVKVPELELYHNHLGTTSMIYEGLNDKQMLLFLFKSSLITETTQSEFIALPEPIKPKREFSSNPNQEPIEVTEINVEKALELYVEKTGENPHFKFSNIISDDQTSVVVSLRKTRPYHCPVCDRIHQSENPYLIFWASELHVSFDCRRSEGERFYLGCLNPQEIVSEPIETPKVKVGKGLLFIAGKSLPGTPIKSRHIL